MPHHSHIIRIFRTIIATVSCPIRVCLCVRLAMSTKKLFFALTIIHLCVIYFLLMWLCFFLFPIHNILLLVWFFCGFFFSARCGRMNESMFYSSAYHYVEKVLRSGEKIKMFQSLDLGRFRSLLIEFCLKFLRSAEKFALRT